MKTLKAAYLPLLLSILLGGLTACLSEDRKKESYTSKEKDTLPKKEVDEKINRIKKIFFSLPSPLELTYLFKQEGIEYQKEKLHDINERKKYVLPIKKALNLGVYGANLSYAGLFGKHQDAIEYFTTTQLMAEELGVGQSFQKEFISRLEKNANDKDTLLQVVSDFFMDNENYLNDRNQQDISTYILIGGWVEGLYLGTEMAQNPNATGIRKIILEQESSLKNLLILLNQLNQPKGSQDLLDSLTALNPYFQKLNETADSAAAINKNQTTAQQESFEQIRLKVSRIRNLIIE